MSPSGPAPSPRVRALLDAAVRVQAGAGLRGLTHRAVDAEAGLPQGTCSAYLRTRLALLTALAEHVAGQLAEDIEQTTRRIEAARPTGPAAEAPSVLADRAVTETAALLRGWLAEPDLLLVRMELVLEGSRQPDLAAVFARQSEQLVALVAHAMTTPEDVGERESRASTLIGALDGVLLAALRQPPGAREQRLEVDLGRLLHGLLEEPGR